VDFFQKENLNKSDWIDSNEAADWIVDTKIYCKGNQKLFECW